MSISKEASRLILVVGLVTREKHSLNCFVADDIPGNQETAIGIIHQIGPLGPDHQRSNALCRRWPTTIRSAPICLAKSAFQMLREGRIPMFHSSRVCTHAHLD